MARISDPRLSPTSGRRDVRDGLVAGAGRELLDDGQEEVFSYSAVEAGEVADPKALGPEELQRSPKSPGSLRAPPGPGPR